jgi:hypothetical protein
VPVNEATVARLEETLRQTGETLQHEVEVRNKEFTQATIRGGIRNIVETQCGIYTRC